MFVVLGPAPASAGSPGAWWAVDGDDAAPLGSCPAGSVAWLVAGLPARLGVDPSTVRWVLADVGTEYAAWLAAGVRVDRCWDVALVQRILRHAATAPGSGVRYTPVAQLEVADPTEPERPARVPAGQESFFDLPDESGPAPDVTVLVAELAAQRAAVEGSAHPHRLLSLIHI